jgi:hypothetical protein
VTVQPPYTFEQAQDWLKENAKHPRITAEFIAEQINNVDYLTHGISTIAVVVLKNGFKVFGHSTPADPKNFNAEIGQSYAYDNAFRQLWPLFGFTLREYLNSKGE